jgi:hypothetical protein
MPMQHFVRRARQHDLVGEAPRLALDRVELRQRLRPGARVTLRVERALADVDDVERAIEAAGAHLREVDLARAPATRVVAHGAAAVGCGRGGLGREALADVLVRVERQRPPVDRARAGQELGLGPALGELPDAGVLAEACEGLCTERERVL